MKNKLRFGIKAGVLVGGFLFLAACAGELSAIPMASVSSSGEVMRGSVVPSMDFSGRFSLAARNQFAIVYSERFNR